MIEILIELDWKLRPNPRSTRPWWVGGASIMKLSSSGELIRYALYKDVYEKAI